MQSINKLLPVEVDFKEVFNFVTSHGTPLCLYTYETCNACYSSTSPLYVRDDENSQENYSIMDRAVRDTYGHSKMDNKITLKYSVPYDIDEDANFVYVPVYITFWDGRISISTEVCFFREIEGANAYRVVEFENTQF